MYLNSLGNVAPCGVGMGSLDGVLVTLSHKAVLPINLSHLLSPATFYFANYYPSKTTKSIKD